MQIIFDEKLIPELKQRYVILELDTILQPGMNSPLTLHALVENVDLDTITNLVDLIKQHEEMIAYYRTSKWEKAEGLAQSMRGSWRGEIDEFYDLVIETCNKNQSENIVWDGIRYITPSET